MIEKTKNRNFFRAAGVALAVVMCPCIIVFGLGMAQADQGQTGTGAVQQLPVDLSIAGEAAEDKLLSGAPVTDQPHAAPGALLQKADILKFGPQLFGQPGIHDDHPKI